MKNVRLCSVSWLSLALASFATVVFLVLLTGGPAFAAHVPVALDVAALWAPAPGAGYLNFVEPGPALDKVGGAPLGISGTEEYTGWVDNVAGPFGATGATLDVSPAGAPAVDNGLTHADHADFDFVVENRPIEVGAIAPPVGLAPLHAGTVGFLTWEIAPTAPSPHIDPSTGLLHSAPHGPLTLALPDYGGPSFTGVDVFSVIADPAGPLGLTDPFGLVSDGDPGGPRDAALDYNVDFCDDTTGACVPGMPVLVFVPGWTAAAVADDYVARWIPAGPPPGFAATHVLIDPVVADAFHDEIIQIDAVVSFIPEPSSLLLAAIGLLGLIGCGWRRKE